MTIQRELKKNVKKNIVNEKSTKIHTCANRKNPIIYVLNISHVAEYSFWRMRNILLLVTVIWEKIIDDDTRNLIKENIAEDESSTLVRLKNLLHEEKGIVWSIFTVNKAIKKLNYS